MKERTLIIVGDNLGLANEQVDYPDIEFIHYPVLVDGQEYFDSKEHSALWLVDKFKKEKIVAKSSSLSRQELVDAIEKNKNKYDLIVHVLMDQKMSNATFEMAEQVKKQYENVIPIVNIDTRQVANGVGAVLLRLIDELKKANDLDEFLAASKKVVQNTFSFFVLADLDYLYRGGRIGKAKALLGSAFRITPLVGLFGDDPDGLIVPVGQARSFRQVNSLLVETMSQKMKEKGAQRVKLINAIDFKDNVAAFEDLQAKLKATFPCDRSIIGTPRLVEAIYFGPQSYGVSFCLD